MSPPCSRSTSAAATPPGAAAPCLVACFDGTGYWPDGSIAGGEFFLAGQPGGAGSPGIRRVAHLAPFPLPGGDAAIRHPWRTALAVLHAAGVPWEDWLPAVRGSTVAERRLLGQQLDRGLACTPTTSMGRLFDAVAAILGGPASVSFEAEAALWLESQAAGCPAGEACPIEFTLAAARPDEMIVGWSGLIRVIVAELAAGSEPARVAAGFHAAVVRLIVEVRGRLLPDSGGLVGLSGGVFQNALLVEQAAATLRSAGCEPLLHHAVPPNDGGLALGQALLARRQLMRDSPAAEAVQQKFDCRENQGHRTRS